MKDYIAVKTTTNVESFKTLPNLDSIDNVVNSDLEAFSRPSTIIDLTTDNVKNPVEVVSSMSESSLESNHQTVESSDHIDIGIDLT